MHISPRSNLMQICHPYDGRCNDESFILGTFGNLLFKDINSSYTYRQRCILCEKCWNGCEFVKHACIVCSISRQNFAKYHARAVTTWRCQSLQFSTKPQAYIYVYPSNMLYTYNHSHYLHRTNPLITKRKAIFCSSSPRGLRDTVQQQRQQ